MARRTQHPAFGSELRALIRSKVKEEKEIGGIITDELDALDEVRAENKKHPKEDQLNGPLAGIRYLRLYGKKQSIRLYFTTVDGTIYMLAIDVGKRREHLTEGMERRLLDRVRDIEKRAAS